MNSFSIQDKIINILKLGRFFFVLGGFFLFLVGALFAVLNGAELNIWKLVFGYVILFLGHLSVSYSNDYFDFEADKLGDRTNVSGGSGILQLDPSLRETSKIIALSLIFISIILGVIFTLYFNYSLVFLGYVIFGNLLGWFYTAPPIRLSYRGLGELSTMLAIGFVVPGMGYYVMKGFLDTNYMLFTIPLLMYGIYFILSVEIPDMEVDSLSGKKSFVTKNGRNLSLKLIFMAALFATIMYVIFQMINPFDFNINFLLVSVLSLIPLFFSSFGLNKDTRARSVKIAFNNLNGLILFAFLTNIYFLIIITSG
ncbi:MAG: 1,4-dihydroxy-2-naphthoate octaprenyltransferase [Candidatus Methanofastidiosum methylothiophilum]|uniref:1,4-dihydroxy-2-naphthoate octaprenyltransferase n=1 Tax=Candidatus Methanofastidiosum methylothiophilum TaxID=1705564 RepID=A0A150IZQ0_9EURY|nr:MAG: 1,4-dihydroxy-2-naphthoate octaprenyltransferase [Candidatus Methanofastidiosum methylthiophilus]KYC48075.1 MAG: 1,4-dihydroxy-2-naphthoate octaprenyltransferase [Candidatus Methanofastidiosum methylthiophilus]KYC50466.1 MAG: 1,4-dihydroxy-2-naphthoate octaprenyltransferase [Candidatus Methanofastidiosum methylthiophilus]